MDIGEVALIVICGIAVVVAANLDRRLQSLEEQNQRLQDACDGKDLTIVALARENEILKSLAEDSLQKVISIAPYLGQRWH